MGQVRGTGKGDRWGGQVRRTGGGGDRWGEQVRGTGKRNR